MLGMYLRICKVLILQKNLGLQITKNMWFAKIANLQIATLAEGPQM
jgi:hypothetical protein